MTFVETYFVHVFTPLKSSGCPFATYYVVKRLSAEYMRPLCHKQEINHKSATIYGD